MAYFNECPYCGANLDPCEKCDCEMSEKERIDENDVYMHEMQKSDRRNGTSDSRRKLSVW